MWNYFTSKLLMFYTYSILYDFTLITFLQIVKSKDLIPSIDNPMVPSMGSPLSWPENAETMYDSTLTGYRFLKCLYL